MNSTFNLLVLLAFLLFTRSASGQTTTSSFPPNLTSVPSSEAQASQTSQTLQLTTAPADPAAACSWARSELSSCSAKQSALTTAAYLDQSSCLCSNTTTIYGSSSALFDAEVSKCATYLLSASYTLYPTWTSLVGFCATRLSEVVPVPPEITIPHTTTGVSTSVSATTSRSPTKTPKPPPNIGGSNSVTTFKKRQGRIAGIILGVLLVITLTM
ncbi:hypothetical protein B0J14DRAFT_281607 [Halenospora varia]|nr:hypothetical protein B0J14DRAFT_281607 [Halenospora varia]